VQHARSSLVSAYYKISSLNIPASVLAIDTIFDAYHIQSAAPSNAINLEVPLPPLLSALRSTLSNATSASIRLTKRDGAPYLVITIGATIERFRGRDRDFGSGVANSDNHINNINNEGVGGAARFETNDEFPDDDLDMFNPATAAAARGDDILRSAPNETIITQDIPIRVLSAESVAGLHEPRCREPDVHVVLPPLMQLKSVSDRFTKLALATAATSLTSTARGRSAGGDREGAAAKVKLELSATMHGDLRLALRNDGLNIASTWTGLTVPELDPGALEGGEEGVAKHPSTRMRGRVGRDGGGDGNNDDDEEDEDDEDEDDMLKSGWARVRIDGKDWSKVLSVGRLGGRVIACELFDTLFFSSAMTRQEYPWSALPPLDNHGENLRQDMPPRQPIRHNPITTRYKEPRETFKSKHRSAAC